MLEAGHEEFGAPHLEMKIVGIQDHLFESSKDKREQRAKESNRPNQDQVLEAPSYVGGRSWGWGPQEKVDLTVPYLSLKQKEKSVMLTLSSFNISIFYSSRILIFSFFKIFH